MCAITSSPGDVMMLSMDTYRQCGVSAKIFKRGFKQATVLNLGHCLSKHKTTR